jgi:hypothetical protein
MSGWWIRSVIVMKIKKAYKIKEDIINQTNACYSYFFQISEDTKDVSLICERIKKELPLQIEQIKKVTLSSLYDYLDCDARENIKTMSSEQQMKFYESGLTKKNYSFLNREDIAYSKRGPNIGIICRASGLLLSIVGLTGLIKFRKPYLFLPVLLSGIATGIILPHFVFGYEKRVCMKNLKDWLDKTSVLLQKSADELIAAYSVSFDNLFV